jgi:hypothetical protein
VPQSNPFHGVPGIIRAAEVDATTITYDKALAELQHLSRNNWRIGEIADRVEAKYGEQTLQHLAEDSGIDYEQLKNCRTVWRAWPELGERSPDLPWSVHRVFASQPDRRELILGKWTVKEARELVASRHTPSNDFPPPRPLPEPPPTLPAPAPAPAPPVAVPTVNPPVEGDTVEPDPYTDPDMPWLKQPKRRAVRFKVRVQKILAAVRRLRGPYGSVYAMFTSDKWYLTTSAREKLSCIEVTLEVSGELAAIAEEMKQYGEWYLGM